MKDTRHSHVIVDLLELLLHGRQLCRRLMTRFQVELSTDLMLLKPPVSDALAKFLPRNPVSVRPSAKKNSAFRDSNTPSQKQRKPGSRFARVKQIKARLYFPVDLGAICSKHVQQLPACFRGDVSVAGDLLPVVVDIGQVGKHIFEHLDVDPIRG